MSAHEEARRVEAAMESFAELVTASTKRARYSRLTLVAFGIAAFAGCFALSGVAL